MQLPFTYKVTRWDPATRTVQPDGTVDGDEQADTDGSIEAACLDAISTFARELGVERLTLRDIELWYDDSDLDGGTFWPGSPGRASRAATTARPWTSAGPGSWCVRRCGPLTRHDVNEYVDQRNC